MVIFNIVILVAAFAALVKGADIFVEGSASLARLFKVPGVVIGLTVVAMGTSLPELAVSTSAALKGANEIALSNVVGSNLFNLLVVLGLCAVIHAVPVDKVILVRDFPLSIVITLVLLVVSAFPALFGGRFLSLAMEENAGLVSRPLALAFLLVFVAYLVYLVVDARKNPVAGDDDIDQRPLWKCLLFITGGIILIVAGGKAVVYSAQNIARAAGMTETLIGLTVVALGTSLPELVTSIVAARKGETALAVGNVVGSNIFNLLFILGVSAAIRPVAVNTASVFDMLILLAVSLMTLFFLLPHKRLGRAGGSIMLVCYAATAVFAVIR